MDATGTRCLHTHSHGAETDKVRQVHTGHAAGGECWETNKAGKEERSQEGQDAEGKETLGQEGDI